MKMIKRNFLPYALVCILLASCASKEQLPVETSISRDAQPIANGTCLFTADSSHYFREMELTDHFCFFVDTEHEVTLHAYDINDFSKPCPLVSQENTENQRIVPSFYKHLPRIKGDEDVLTIINNANQKRIVMNKETKKAETTKQNYFRNLVNSATFYAVKEEIYGSPRPRYRTNPFYFYDTALGYYWVDTEPNLKIRLGSIPTAHINEICVNATAGVVASAYRFTNQLSFYDLKGVLLSTVQCGSDTIIPIAHARENNKIDVLNSTKCFIDLYGTANYLYCLYAGTADYSEPSKIMIFRWDGSHVKTLEMDRYVRSIAVEQTDEYIMAIAANKENGQDIIRYAVDL